MITAGAVAVNSSVPCCQSLEPAGTGSEAAIRSRDVLPETTTRGPSGALRRSVLTQYCSRYRAPGRTRTSCLISSSSRVVSRPMKSIRNERLPVCTVLPSIDIRA